MVYPKGPLFCDVGHFLHFSDSLGIENCCLLIIKPPTAHGKNIIIETTSGICILTVHVLVGETKKPISLASLQCLLLGCCDIRKRLESISCHGDGQCNVLYSQCIFHKRLQKETDIL